MGSACSSSSATETTSDVNNRPPNTTKTTEPNNNNDGDGDSTGSSASSDISRPPTPFSRPLTGRVAQRPRTTTIFEREDQRQLNAKAAKEMRSKSPNVLSVNDDEGGGGGGIRKISRQMTASDEEDIEKLKEFLKEKGL